MAEICDVVRCEVDPSILAGKADPSQHVLRKMGS